MTDNEINLLEIDRGLVISPAGCGKTQLITNALIRHNGSKPILVLTHTNAGVAALRSRLDRADVDPSKYRLATIDGWAIRLISTFPERAGHNSSIIMSQKPNYARIREAAAKLISAGHINDIISASYARLLVDEYQDCSTEQHAIVYYTSHILPTCVLGDPMQAIFGFKDDRLADWNTDVRGHFTTINELNHPWRWSNAGTEALGNWLLEVRKKLESGEPINLKEAPPAVTWVQTDGTANDHQRLLKAGRVTPPDAKGAVLILGYSNEPPRQQKFASQTPGAVTVEAVHLGDLIFFSRNLNINDDNALAVIVVFAQKIMTGIGAAELLRRVTTLSGGTARKDPTDVENAALAFQRDRTYQNVINLLSEMSKEAGTHTFRPGVMRPCIRALQICAGQEGTTFYEAALRIRDEYPFHGRTLPKRAVGSTLLLKGLEAEVAVILDADSINAPNLYVAMTRGSKRLIICSKSHILNPIR